jgi:hypothetical protein
MISKRMYFMNTLRASNWLHPYFRELNFKI